MPYCFWWKRWEHGACFARFWLGYPMLCIRYQPHRSELKMIHRIIFFTLRPSRVRFPYIKKQHGLMPYCFWWKRWEHGACFARFWLGYPMLCIRYQPHRSELKMIHRIIFFTLRPSRVRFPYIKKQHGLMHTPHKAVISKY